ncbi:hypothetical protein ACMFMG_003579 [Clarireedia jacksonii]
MDDWRVRMDVEREWERESNGVGGMDKGDQKKSNAFLFYPHRFYIILIDGLSVALHLLVVFLHLLFDCRFCGGLNILFCLSSMYVLSLYLLFKLGERESFGRSSMGEEERYANSFSSMYIPMGLGIVAVEEGVIYINGWLNGKERWKT